MQSQATAGHVLSHWGSCGHDRWPCWY